MDAFTNGDSVLERVLEGRGEPEDVPTDSETPKTPFTPNISQIRERLRKLRDSAAVAVTATDDEIIECFRYFIVASQLLSDLSATRRTIPDDEGSVPLTVTIRGAITTALLSFFAAWLMWCIQGRRRNLSSISWVELGIYTILLSTLLVVLILFARRRYLRLIHRANLSAISRYIHESHEFDATINKAVRFIQEVEVVARGFNLGSPLPPVSRLEEDGTARRCQLLRSAAASALLDLLNQHDKAHLKLQPLVNIPDLQQYHNVYDISLGEYAESIRIAEEASKSDLWSLRQLRQVFELLVSVRKVFLCDLLALSPGKSWQDALRWRAALQETDNLARACKRVAKRVSDIVAQEQWGHADVNSEDGTQTDIGVQPPKLTPSKQLFRAQISRFDAVVNGVRALHARMHIIKDELKPSIESGPDAAASENLHKQYESIGVELRSLLMEWERGRNTMHLHVDRGNRQSRSSDGRRSPISTSPSLGGVTVVDGGPVEALKALIGDAELRENLDADALDEEVFEAVASPRRRTTFGLSRPEKMAMLEEDRKKRATQHEQAETTTNMLRELQMVMKHRPQNLALSIDAPKAKDQNGVV